MDGTCKNASNYPCDYRVCDRVECAIEHELRSDSRTAPTHRSLSIDSFSALAQLAFSDAFSSNLKRKQPLSVDIGNFTEHLVDCNRGLRLHQMHFHRRFQFNYSKHGAAFSSSLLFGNDFSAKYQSAPFNIKFVLNI